MQNKNNKYSFPKDVKTPHSSHMQNVKCAPKKEVKAKVDSNTKKSIAIKGLI
jgi:hypothetical protein